MAQSGLARLTGGQKVAGSNPVAPTRTSFLTRFFYAFSSQSPYNCAFYLNSISHLSFSICLFFTYALFNNDCKTFELNSSQVLKRR
jgi:hypothetical protein